MHHPFLSSPLTYTLCPKYHHMLAFTHPTHTSCSAPPHSSGNFGTGLNPPVGPRGLNGLGGSHMALGGMGGMGF